MIRKWLQSPSAWAIASASVRTGAVLATLPLALTSIPEAEMGLYYTFTSLAAFGALLDMGFGHTLSRFAAYVWAGSTVLPAQGLPPKLEGGGPNFRLLRLLVINARSFYLAAGALLLILLVLPGGWFIRHQIERSGLSPVLEYCWLAMALTISGLLASDFWKTLLFGAGGVKEAHQAIVVAHGAGAVLLTGGLLGGLGIWSFPLSRALTISIVWSLARASLLRRIRRSGGPALELGLEADFSLVPSLWPMAWRQGVVTVGEYLALRGNVLICSILFGLEMTARYGLWMQVIGAMAAICSAPAVVLEPRISQLRVARDSAQIVRLFGPRLYLGLVAMLASGIVAMTYGQSLLTWIGSDTGLPVGSIMLLLLVIQALQIHQKYYGFLVLSENLNPFVVPTLLSGVGVTVLAYLFGTRWGLLGLVLAQGLVPLVFLNWWTVWRGIRGLELPASRLVHYLAGRE